MPSDPQYRPHAKAVAFPSLSDEKYAALKRSIDAHGQQQPIEVQKGTIYVLDGCHRLKAIAELNAQLETASPDLLIKPKTVEIPIADDEVPFYTGAKAVHRDDLTATQKALLALALVPAFKARAAERQALGKKVDGPAWSA